MSHDPNAIIGSDGTSVLIATALLEEPENVRALLDSGADINYQDLEGRTALMNMMRSGRAKCLDEILADRPNLDLKDNDGNTALMLALHQGYPELAARLIDKGASIHEKDNLGNTVLILASSTGYVEIVNTLITAGADLGAKNGAGYTARDFAEDKGHPDVVQVLEQAAEAKKKRLNALHATAGSNQQRLKAMAKSVPRWSIKP